MSTLRTLLTPLWSALPAAIVLSAALTSPACATPKSPGPTFLTLSTKHVEAKKDGVTVIPPGLVLIPGGRTIIGTPVKDIEKMLVANYGERQKAGAYISETPQFKKEVPEFALMVTEVTNEQFAAYISASGSKPPETWGRKAIEAAAREFLIKQGEARKKAEEEGRPIPPRVKFDEQGWWDRNWQEAEWEIPKGEEHRPVVFTSHQDAADYSRWAGLRLMTEFEYQRAVRGKTDNFYPWGKEWKKDHSVSSDHSGSAQTMDVGSYKAGVSEQGVYDLIGNVWEWTSSPYVQFPKYKEKTFTIGKGKNKESLTALANWDANKRVSVGGGYHANEFVARATTRRGASRTQTADSLGFRCAASLAPGIDIAERVMRDELDASSRPSNPDGAVQYAAPDTLAVDRWKTKALEDDGRPVPGYEVITGYDYIIFTPADKIWGVDVNDLNKRIIEEGPEPIGFLSTNQRILTPDLDPGTYMISYRCKGKPKVDNSMDKGKEEEPKEGEPQEEEEYDPWDLGEYETELGLDPSKAYFLFFNPDIKLVGVVEAIEFDKLAGKLTGPGSASFFDKDYTIKEKDENGKDVDVEVHEQWLRFDANVRARASRRGFKASIGVQVETDLDASSFRVSKGQ